MAELSCLGKSSIMKKLEHELSWNGEQVAYVDLQVAENSHAGFIPQIGKGFPELIAIKWGEAFLKSIEEINLSLLKINLNQSNSEWRKLGEKLQKILADKELIILLDEFSLFLNELLNHNKQEAKLFLN